MVPHGINKVKNIREKTNDVEKNTETGIKRGTANLMQKF